MKMNSARHIWMILINVMQISTHNQEKLGLPGRMSQVRYEAGAPLSI